MDPNTTLIIVSVTTTINAIIALITLIMNRNQAVVAEKKLDTIHILVNSNMTAAMQSEVDTLRRELVLLVHADSLKKNGDPKTKAAATLEIERTKIRIGELQAKLDDRLKASDAAEDAQKKSKPTA